MKAKNNFYLFQRISRSPFPRLGLVSIVETVQDIYEIFSVILLILSISQISQNIKSRLCMQKVFHIVIFHHLCLKPHHFCMQANRCSRSLFSTIISLVIYTKLQKKLAMGQRKTWTPEEDQILRQLYQQRAIKKWSTISQIMEDSYKIEGRNGKQCRQRYHNHLKNGIRKERWTKDQEQKLVGLHSKYGNRWALISKFILGRTENCVKNMFNSKLRKSVRLLNRFIYLYYRKSLKQIKISFVNRLSEFSQNAHKKPETKRNTEQNKAIELKNQILKQDNYEVHQMSQEQKLRVKDLCEQIHAFKKENYKNYRGNMLARLRKQKLRHKPDEQSAGMQEKFYLHPKQIQTTESLSKQQQQKQINLFKQHNSIEFVRQQPAPTSNNNQNRRRPSLCRLQSFESNLPVNGLQMPIEVDKYMVINTPLPHCNEVDFVDWSLLEIDWRCNID